LRWTKVPPVDEDGRQPAQCWIERDQKTSAWTVTYWGLGANSMRSRCCTLGSTDLISTLIFAEVEGVTHGG
jgi:hypothetical protein